MRVSGGEQPPYTASVNREGYPDETSPDDVRPRTCDRVAVIIRDLLLFAISKQGKVNGKYPDFC